MGLTSPFDAPERSGQMLHLPLAATTLIYAGSLVALNADGNAVPATDAAGLRVIGRAEHTVDNSAGSAGDSSINVKRGVFLYLNSETNAVDLNDVGKRCFVEDDAIVAETSTHKVVAGRVVGVVSEGVWIDTTEAHNVPSVDTLTALTFSTDATGTEVAALRAAILAILQAQNLVK